MRSTWCAFALASAFATTPAIATAAAYVSATGGGTACTLAAPCASIGAAITAAGPKGEVICLNKGNYGSVIISQSVTISCGDGLWDANGALVKVTTPAGSAVVIEGLVLEEGNYFGVSIQFTGQGVLDLRRVRGGNLSGPNANGVFVNCNGPSKVWISDSYFYNYAQSGILIQPTAGSTVDVNIRNTVFSGNASGGIFVSPSSGAKAFVALDQVSATGNSFGLGVGDGGTAVVRDSTFTGNANYGVVAFSSSAPSSVALTNSMIAKTGSYGVLTGGSGVTVSLSQMRIFGNGVGVFSSGGSILSFGNNAINGNGTDGSPTGAVALK